MGRHSARVEDDEDDAVAGAAEPSVGRGRHAEAVDDQPEAIGLEILEAEAPAPETEAPTAESPAAEAEVPLADQTTDPIGPVEAPVGQTVEAPVGQTVEAPVGQTVVAPVEQPVEQPVERTRVGKVIHTTTADLALLREHSDVRARCIAAAVVPFVLYTAVLLAIGSMGVYLLWIWIPTVSAGALAGAFLDAAHRRHNPPPQPSDDPAT
jgi:hypothetical protein